MATKQQKIMRYITANQLHDGYKFLENETVLVIDDEGTILDLLPLASCADKPVKQYEGILCPGFVNAHCHLELSHLKGAIPEHTGLVKFVQSIPSKRFSFDKTSIASAIDTAIQTMESNGIVAVGDIANTDATLSARQISKLHIHTFVETMGFIPFAAANRFVNSLQIWSAYKNHQTNKHNKILQQTIVPHAPYSVAENLLALIDQLPENYLLSIHNQESQAETDFFKNKSGAMLDLYAGLGIDISYFVPPNVSSLAYTINKLEQPHQIILVHNTFTQQQDIDLLKKSTHAYYWCLCPQANWYIEKKLPNIPMLDANHLMICLGTDSLASNHTLSIWHEIQIIQEHYPDIPLEKLLQWATINGAQALQMDSTIGSFTIGKKPGCNIIHPSGVITVL